VAGVVVVVEEVGPSRRPCSLSAFALRRLISNFRTCSGVTSMVAGGPEGGGVEGHAVAIVVVE